MLGSSSRMMLGVEKSIWPCDNPRLATRVLMSPRMPIAFRVEALLRLRGKAVMCVQSGPQAAVSSHGCYREANNIVPKDKVVEVFKRMVRISRSKKGRRHGVQRCKQSGSLTWETCSRIALQNVETTTSFRLANIINCCKKGGYFDQDLLSALFARAMDCDPALMHEFSSVEVSMTVQSLGMLSRGARHGSRNHHEGAVFRTSCKDFVHALMIECINRNLFSDEKYDVRELSNTVHGLGLVEDDISEPDVRRCIDRLVEEFSTKASEGDCVGQDFSQLLHGCAKLGYRNERRMFEVCELLKWSLSSQAMFEDQTLGTISWALGKLGVRDYELLEMLGTQIVDRIEELTTRGLANVIYAYGLSGFRSDVVLEALGQEIVREHRLSQCNAQDLSNGLYGFGLLGFDNQAVLVPLGREIVKKLDSRQFTTQSLANIVYGLGKTKCFDGDVIKSLLEECKLHLKGFSNQSLTLITYGLALMAEDCVRHIPGPICRFLEAVSREILERRARGGLNLNLQDSSNLIWGLAELGYHDRELFSVLIDRFLWLVDAGFKPKPVGVNMILSACACTGFESEKFNEFFGGWSEIRLRAEALNIRQLSSEMWAKALFGVLTINEYNTLSSAIKDLQSKGHDLQVEDCQRILQSWLYISVVLGESCETSSCSLVEEARRGWTSNPDVLTSRFEGDVCKLLDKIGVTYRSQELLLDGLIPVDIFIPGDTPAVIECDGPSHYTVNKPEGKFLQLGRTRFRNRLLEASGVKVVCVPYFLRENDRESLIREALQESGHL
ncbi:hypothetical protein BSKO_11682 [Bryopsis sp. KO-2023]|nr:hypothetical protein BSKO_11682 [Bryopsis sp. KO-2023]